MVEAFKNVCGASLITGFSKNYKGEFNLRKYQIEHSAEV